MTENTEKKTKPLMVTRVAGIRGQGSKSLYCHGYAELSEVLGVPAIEVAEYVHEGTIDPLNLVELALVRKHGIDRVPGAALEEAAKLRPQSVTDVCVAAPPPVEAPLGLETLWAYSHADVADQAGVSHHAIRRLRKPGRSPHLDMTSLASIVDVIVALHPLTK